MGKEEMKRRRKGEGARKRGGRKGEGGKEERRERESARLPFLVRLPNTPL